MIISILKESKFESIFELVGRALDAYRRSFAGLAAKYITVGKAIFYAK